MRRKLQERIAEVDEVPVRLRIEPLGEGGYVATSLDVPGLVAEGRSITEAVEIAQGLARKIVESCLEHGDPLPPALMTITSLRFLPCRAATRRRGLSKSLLRASAK